MLYYGLWKKIPEMGGISTGDLAALAAWVTVVNMYRRWDRKEGVDHFCIGNSFTAGASETGLYEFDRPEILACCPGSRRLTNRPWVKAIVVCSSFQNGSHQSHSYLSDSTE